MQADVAAMLWETVDVTIERCMHLSTVTKLGSVLLCKQQTNVIPTMLLRALVTTKIKCMFSVFLCMHDSPISVVMGLCSVALLATGVPLLNSGEGGIPAMD